MRERHSARNSKLTGRRYIKVGDVVIFKEYSTKYIYRKMGIAQTLLIGKDGSTWAAIVKVANIERLLKRSVRDLFPLEITCQAANEAVTRHKPEKVSILD